MTTATVLAPKTHFVKLSEAAFFMACALHPDDIENAEQAIMNGMLAAAMDRKLDVRIPLSLEILDPDIELITPFEFANLGVILTKDFIRYVTGKGITVCYGKESSSTDTEGTFDKLHVEVNKESELQNADLAESPTLAPCTSDDGSSSGNLSPKRKSNRSPETVIFAATVLEFMSKVWNSRQEGTHPTKSEMCKQVLDEILRTNIRGARKTTLGMVNDHAKAWKQPLVLGQSQPASRFNTPRHPFKGEK